MPSERLKIRVNSLVDMHELLAGLAGPRWPSDIYLPLTAYNCIFERVQSTSKGWDLTGEFVYFEGTRVRPPRADSNIIDLSDAELLDAE